MPNELKTGYRMAVIEIDWTAQADGAVPDEVTESVAGYLVRAVAIPGSPAPTDLYSAYAKDPDGIDLLGGKMKELSSSAPQQAVPVDRDFSPAPMWVEGPLTVSIAGNAVNGAQGKLKLYIARL